MNVKVQCQVAVFTSAGERWKLSSEAQILPACITGVQNELRVLLQAPTQSAGMLSYLSHLHWQFFLTLSSYRHGLALFTHIQVHTQCRTAQIT